MADSGENEGIIRVKIQNAEAEDAATGDGAQASFCEEREDASAGLQTQLAEAKAQADEYLDQWRRSAAQFANYRKRIEKEQSEFSLLANANLITKLLPVMDDFERALNTMDGELRTTPWAEGLELIHHKLEQVLAQEGLQIIETEGQRFDPEVHHAVTYEDADGHDEGEIIAEVQRGYRLGERLLRASMVRVAR